MKMTAPMEVGLTVRDLPRMRAFYEGALGLAFVSEIHVPPAKAREAAMSAGGYTVVRLQTPYGERIKLLSPDDAPAARTGVSDRILDRADASYLTFIVDDIDSVVARLIAGGIGGGMFGTFAADQISRRSGRLNLMFAALIFGVAGYMLWRSAAAFGVTA